MAAAVTVTEARWPEEDGAGLELRTRWGLKFGTTDRGVVSGREGPARVGHLFPSRTA